MAGHGHPDFRLVQPTTRKRDRADKSNGDKSNGDKSGDEFVVDRANGMLRVEQAAEIIHDAGLRPVEAARRVFLVQDVHAANPGFGNKLLKTLEEPPDHVVLILTALDRDGVLPTIVSRCQVLELRPLDEATIAAALTRDHGVDAAQATLLARLANGRMGWTLQQVADAAGGERRQEQVAQLLRLITGTRVERLAYAEQLAAGRNNQQLFPMLALWTAWWRDVMLVQAGFADACSNIDQATVVAKLAATLAPDEVRGYLGTLQRIEGYLRHTVNTRLALDVLLLQMPHAAV
jgi:DNA polymerase-3 subunit delta'